MICPACALKSHILQTRLTGHTTYVCTRGHKPVCCLIFDKKLSRVGLMRLFRLFFSQLTPGRKLEGRNCLRLHSHRLIKVARSICKASGSLKQLNSQPAHLTFVIV
jgi:hypothetical protein